MAWDVSGRIGGGAIPTLKRTVGTGGWTKGDPLVESSGTLIKATAGSATTAIKYVAAETAVATAVAVVFPLMPDVKLRIKGSGSPVVGTKYGITATTFLVDATNTTQTRVVVIGVDEADSTMFECVSLDWLA